MKKRIHLLTLVWLLCPLAVSAEDKPNIIIILTDDQGYQDIGCFGSPDIKTPHLDKMATEGMRFTDFYVASAVCSPSRAALLTGCYPLRVGVPRVLFPNGKAEGLAPEHTTIAEVLKTVGYTTMAVGKWHLGDEKQFLPTNQGFDSYYGIPYSNDMYPAKSMDYAADCLWLEGMTAEKVAQSFAKSSKGRPQSMRDKVPLMRDEVCIEFPADQATISRRYTDEAIQFIKKSSQDKKPFFLYLAHTMPHTPLYASKDFMGKSKRGLYGDVIEEIDYNVGRILTELKSLGVKDNTIVVYTSDNGPWLVKGKNGGSAQPLFEGKMTTFEGGQRVPTIIQWPAKIPSGSTCGELATAMDLMPTFAAIAGVEIAPSPQLDGKSILNLLTGEKGAKTPHEFFYFGTTAVRSGDWKYNAREQFKVKSTRRPFKGPTLYNLKQDIGEKTNLIKEHPEIAERLRKILEAHNESYKEIQSR